MRGLRKRELRLRLAETETRLQAVHQELAERTLRDPLTGLHTPQAFIQRLDGEVERSRRYGRPLSLAALDVDGFGSLNRAHGRDAGDVLLRAVAELLVRSTRASDVVGRSGGDGFLVLLPETTVAPALQAFERILLELETTRVGPIETVSASVGVAAWQQGMTPQALVAEAERRMRSARDAGGGRTKGSPTSGAIPPGPGQDAQRDAIAGLAEALLERDRYTGEHSEFVVDLSDRVARGLALDEVEVGRVRAAALLHDIGKVAIPDEVLNKAGPLNELEWAVMREHPVIGERILRAVPGLGQVARIVRHEHERWDGRGYPDGLREEAIPIGARIILACDAYHAMTSDRPYRRAMSHAEAIRELGVHAGTQFDPQVTETLIGCLYGSRRNGAGVPA